MDPTTLFKQMPTSYPVSTLNILFPDWPPAKNMYCVSGMFTRTSSECVAWVDFWVTDKLPLRFAKPWSSEAKDMRLYLQGPLRLVGLRPQNVSFMPVTDERCGQERNHCQDCGQVNTRGIPSTRKSTQNSTFYCQWLVLPSSRIHLLLAFRLLL